ncbi:hypothetical protein [Streptomyces clavuligerus]|uniref:Uncharacterized protein n=1 Tax=Streptomyces clavuligerus TaxID=1901 RepID=B5GN85_STRCL|nr:hypothetical protein [Streptomyces clavuligerus]ANW22172.1 hypothetical protein BB341_27940 [Streptomyces clavuligerus]AXU17063.1 hypothetical protein D1794_30995 [Streptomyces clavuligerus]EDY47781.1 hypothetical protein SSCG_00809 [Streptomyces clavuligerus]EFG04230.1 Hypothetical protein SCLAV_p0743 [Streptomyces clavuligerus]MBY6307293.1 hypothetical protein [Streptomyces clavuligerus]
MSSGSNYYFGNTVNMHGGENNTGMVNHQSGPVGTQAASPALEEAIRELLTLLRELRANVPPLSAHSIDEALPALTADPAIEPQERHRALMAITGVAATAGMLGVPVLETVRLIMELLGG